MEKNAWNAHKNAFAMNSTRNKTFQGLSFFPFHVCLLDFFFSSSIYLKWIFPRSSIAHEKNHVIIIAISFYALSFISLSQHFTFQWCEQRKPKKRSKRSCKKIYLRLEEKLEFWLHIVQRRKHSRVMWATFMWNEITFKRIRNHVFFFSFLRII